MSKRYGLKFVEILTGMTRRERLLALIRVLKVIHNKKLKYHNGKLTNKTV